MIGNNRENYDRIFKLIENAEDIIIYRHEMPDFDALGTQFGFYHFLKDNFKNKNIFLAGKDHVKFSASLYPHIEELTDEAYPAHFLAIVLDTATKERVDDKRFLNADYIIKIDHHPNVDPFGNLNLVQDELASCGELIADIFFTYESQYVISQECAKYLYSAIVGDTGRFLFSDVNSNTLRLSASLLDKGFDFVEDVYLKMYKKTYHDLEITKYILNNIVFLKTGVAYYILKQDDLDKLGLTVERGKENLSLMSNIDDIEIWMSITENKAKEEFKVSIRSKRIPINDVASLYHGGGHSLASGATLKSLSELEPLINDLNKKVSEYRVKK